VICGACDERADYMTTFAVPSATQGEREAA
jgi:hypothetical protein